ncbi:F0F1 ATP synthase subunit gamma [Buchnera aphidicola str. APS (Acyrthosiphon pisum)]|uniref:ATP synthase gamma chain n=1 Tax=Buchnera aphidicola subsp. Acyrthosiphon pisum (strain APS) TaxID=107806 RepID=ATPG_BUCAI|nr:F0F1 ATP synthase subunit gamma [Buchnera aphidicola]P57123.1 RecName: Full=ATP synthase gamma chain; AltName: Full=ATP synthase F1 sector gamma subunit; AltName: Full=F-ATPase gamma subunit [Buchnera aphidicola str. APS (Acyrthosiphon pisum)]pir/G84930/ H+-transporting two-sector ATPase (EC 3.6.3.14) gamma chain [imported] - Buchnera sp. (strain APS) [Buchnera sp. (in: enterobacteria)]BAB12735.1 ATP synthase gamma chain [Buchnera aphidicola str. APS (Acyrthosiphon pisum)]
MTSTKEIKNKIVSVTNTKKITKAMEMVAVSKMRKTEERMRSGRPYSDIIRKVIDHVTQGNLEYKHSYLEERKTNRIGMIIISTDRGLCGGLNTNLFKQVLFKIQNFAKVNIPCDLILFGLKSLSVFKLCGSNILAKATNLGENPKLEELINSVGIILQEYQCKRIDKIFIAYNKFHNKMSQYPTITQLLPFSKKNDQDASNNNWDYLYEPESKLILDTLFNRYIESQVYQSILENIASEHAARMIAMKTATDNSGNRIKELQLVYNKVRQANITQELNEIVSGASAVSID